ncbi:hypothetical protein DB346_11635 [Verrucomicrobia bacterium LW23]|nr:hypothetical protein DB346_11635 [Verrucomicrobia bacterium LW23]
MTDFLPNTYPFRAPAPGAPRLRPGAALFSLALVFVLVLSFFAGLPLVATSAAAAEAPESLFAQGNKLYQEKKYTEAAAAYEKVIQQNGFSANVLLNLGNACLKDKQYGRAILAFERAARLAPADAEITRNLSIARQEAGLPVTKTPWWLAILKRFSANDWAYAFSGTFALLWIIAGISLWRPESCRLLGVSDAGQLRFWRASVCLVAFACFLLLAALAVSLQPRFDAVVLKAGPAFISPIENAADMFQLSEGEIVNVEGKSSTYYYARNIKGEGGWIPSSRMEPIVPDILR